MADARAAARVIGPERVGMRISPYGVFNGMTPDAGTDTLYARLIVALNGIGLVYIHVVDHSAMGAPPVKETLKARSACALSGQVHPLRRL